MIMVKALASDFDNTLHYKDEEGFGYFKQNDMKAIREFREKGNLFGLCTGRPLYGFEGDMDEGPAVDFVVASTGAIVTKTDHNAFITLKETCITTEQVIDIQKMCDGRGVLYIHANGKVYTLFHKRPEYPTQIVLKDPHQLDEKHITAISVWTASLEMAKTLTDEINDAFPNIINAFQNVNWLDVVCEGVSKGNGALSIKESMHVDMLACIGDSFNDIPMLEKADVAFTFYRADKQVQEKADYLVNSISEAIEILEKL